MAGSKLFVYVLIKILKTCTDSSAKSYQCKYGVQEMLVGVDPVKMGAGNSIKKVLAYYTIRDKFSSVHPDLAKMGFSGVEVTDGGFKFIRNQ